MKRRITRKIKYTASDHRRAVREGWVLSERDDGFYEVQKYDEDPQERFANDDDAYEFVSSKARDEGSYMHQKALHLHDLPWRTEARRS
jgi:hypothetical protein